MFDDVDDDTDGDDEEPPYVHEQWQDVEVCRPPYLLCAPELLVQPGGGSYDYNDDGDDDGNDEDGDDDHDDDFFSRLPNNGDND